MILMNSIISMVSGNSFLQQGHLSKMVWWKGKIGQFKKWHEQC